MIKNPFVGKTVWTVYDPSSGLLEFPSEDTVIEVAPRSHSVLLKTRNYMDAYPYHWSNDYYGNQVETCYLYETLEEAKEFLLEHFSKLYSKNVAQNYRLRETLFALENKC